MSMNLGVNIVPNGSFNDGSGWLVTATGGGIVTFANGQVRLYRPDAGAAANINLNPGKNAVIGRQYFITVARERISGQLRVTYGGVVTQFAASGENTFIITAVTATNLSIGAVDPYPSEHFVNSIIVREVGASMSTVVIGIRDFDGDKPQTSMALGPVTDGASYVTREGQAAAVRDAVNAVCGNIWRYQFLAIDTEPNDTNAASQVIQANHRWKVTFVDSVTGDNVYWYIPTADLTVANLLLTGSNKHNPATQAWIDFKAALNGIAINKKTGSTMTITEIEYEE